MYNDPRLKNEYHAWLLVSNFDFNPEEITKQLGIEPTNVKIKGEYRVVGKKTPRKILNKENLWILDSELPRNIPIEKHIEHLLDKIKPYKQNFIEIAKQYSLQLTGAIYYYEANPGINLDKKILKEITDLNVELGLDIYCLAGTVSQFEYPNSEKELIKQLSQRNFISELNNDTHDETKILADSFIKIDNTRQELDMHMEDLVTFNELTDEEYKSKFNKVIEDLKRIKNSIEQSKYLNSLVNESKEKK
jgi:hypothetical protein